jgi:hypothetical protein
MKRGAYVERLFGEKDILIEDINQAKLMWG